MAAPKKVDALKAEAKNESTTQKITFDGHDYTIEANAMEWPIEVRENLEEGKEIGAARALLGEAQWALIKARSSMTNRKFNELSEKLFEALGESLGESDS